MEIRLAREIQTDSIVDGEGLRTVIWTQGCAHNCKGCHNTKTHDFKGGFSYDVNLLKKDISNVMDQDGITLSGGDPFYQPLECSIIANYAKEIGLNVWCYTGFVFENLLLMAKFDKSIMKLLSSIDVLVDGKFELEKKSLNLMYKGSSNQRIIDVKVSLKLGYTVIIDKYNDIRSYESLYKKSECLFA